MCPPLQSQRAGDLTWEPSKLPGLEGVGQMPSSPRLLLPQCPSRLPLLISPVTLLFPQGPTWPGEGFGGQGIGLGAQQAPWAPVGRAVTLRSSPPPPRGPLSPASLVLPSASFLCPPMITILENDSTLVFAMEYSSEWQARE